MYEIDRFFWRGRSILSCREDKSNFSTKLVGNKSTLFAPVKLEKNSKYEINIQLKKDNGNGIIACNFYANKNFDFPQVIFNCDETWGTYKVILETKNFISSLPFVFRLWRPKNGTGNVSVKKISIGKCNNDIVANSFELISRENIAVNNNVRRRKRLYNNFSKKEKNVVRKEEVKKEEMKRINIKKEIELNFNIVKKLKRIQLEDTRKFDKYITKYDYNKEGKRVLYLYLRIEGVTNQQATDNAFIENGFNLWTFDFQGMAINKQINEIDEKFKEIVNDFKPDWIHMQLQDSGLVKPNTVQYIKENFPNTFITNWTGDIRPYPIKYFIDISKYVDISLVSSIGQLNLYKENGCKNPQYWQIGYDDKRFYKMSDNERNELYEEYDNDIVFCSNPSNYPGHQIRKDACKMLGENFKFGLYGTWPIFDFCKGPCNFFEQQFIYNGSKIVLSVNNFNDVEMYFSDRQLVSMASGTLTLCHYIPGLEKYFENKKHLVWFKDLKECKNLVEYYLKNKNEAEKIGLNGYEIVKNNHTYFHRIKELSERINITNKKKEMFYINKTEKRPKMSMVLGTYNRLDSLKQTIESVNDSNFNDIEIVINDAGSTDGTVEWLKDREKNDNRIKLILSKKRYGITKAYNNCFEMSTGKYVTWLSDDTIVLNNSIEKMYNHMESINKNDTGGYYYIHKGTGPKLPTTLGIDNPPIGCVNLDYFKEIGLWNMDYPHYGQDIEFNARVFRLGGEVKRCEGTLIRHLNICDELKTNNIRHYIKDFSGKFDLVYGSGGKRYSIKSNFKYPVFLIIPNNNFKDFHSVINNIKILFKNINYCIPTVYMKYSNYFKNEKIVFTNLFEKKYWKYYDLILDLNNKKVYDYMGKDIISKYCNILINGWVSK